MMLIKKDALKKMVIKWKFSKERLELRYLVGGA